MSVSSETGGSVSSETGGSVSSETGGSVYTETGGSVYTETGGSECSEIVSNLALRDHLLNGKRVFLFEILGKGMVRFNTELDFIETGYFEALDTYGTLRTAIKFFFKIHGCVIPKIWNRTDVSCIPESVPLTLDLFYTSDGDNLAIPKQTEQLRFVNTRVGQGAYRKSILYRWEFECAVTRFNDPSILVASHIVPWKESNDIQRLDVENGILLSPTYDALFDQHLITFDQKGKILLSDKIEINAYQKIGVTGNEILKDVSDGMIPYLTEHQGIFHHR